MTKTKKPARRALPPRAPTTIQQQWEEFESLVVAKNAPSEQRKEMRLAFFSGASSILGAQLAIPVGTSEDDSVAILESWHAECRKFAKDYVRNAQ